MKTVLFLVETVNVWLNKFKIMQYSRLGKRKIFKNKFVTKHGSSYYLFNIIHPVVLYQYIIIKVRQ